MSEIENMEAAADTGVEKMQAHGINTKKSSRHWILLLLNIVALVTGSIAGPLLTRFYFLNGGSKLWLCAGLETAGWPFLLLPLYLSYRKQPNRENHITPNLLLASCGIGILMGADNYIYTYGLSVLPASTSSVLVASQLGFNAIFALLLVGQKFSPLSINSVVLLTASSVMLAFHTSGDRPAGVTNRQYVVGFVLTLAAAALYGFLTPLLELTYKKTKRQITSTLIIEMQLVMSVVATVFCTVGMLIKGEFQALHREANDFSVGKIDYSMVIVWSAVAWQFFYIGFFGVTSLASSLFCGVIMAVALPLTEVLAVVLFHEKFSAEKGMALVLSLWGFASYLYGEYYCDLKLRPPKLPKQQNDVEDLGGAAHAHHSIDDV